jgi:hypothetical protein
MMLMPGKHIRLAESLIGLGGFVLEHLRLARTIDALWSELKKVNNSNEFPAYQSFENLVLTVDFLFLIGAVDEDTQGRLRRCD